MSWQNWSVMPQYTHLTMLSWWSLNVGVKNIQQLLSAEWVCHNHWYMGHQILGTTWQQWETSWLQTPNPRIQLWRRRHYQPKVWLGAEICASRRPLVCLTIPVCDRISGLPNRLTILKLGLCITLTGLCRSWGLQTGMRGVSLFIKHINVGGHALVGRLSGIWTQRGIVSASKCATVYRHFGEAAVPAGECGPCPVLRQVIPRHSPYNWGKSR